MPKLLTLKSMCQANPGSFDLPRDVANHYPKPYHILAKSIKQEAVEAVESNCSGSMN
jgi:hypothetical protein